MSEDGYIKDVHKELTSSAPWANPGLKAMAQLSWALTLRQLSQYYTSTGKHNWLNTYLCVFNRPKKKNEKVSVVRITNAYSVPYIEKYLKILWSVS